MKNFLVSYIFSDIADMMEIKGENFFKIRAYRKASQVIANLPEDIEEIMKTSSLGSIEGIGKALEGKIKEIIETGTCRHYEELKKDIPRGLVEMLKIPGLGAKRIKTIYDALNITTIDELEQAAKSHKLRGLPGIGVKTEQAILKGIQMLKGKAGKMLLSTALYLAEEIKDMLKFLPAVEKVEEAGSLRRRKELIGNIYLVVSSQSPAEVLEGFLDYPRITEVVARDTDKTSVVLDLGVQVDLRVVEPRSFWAALHHYTGNEDHNVKLKEIARTRGLDINENGVFKEKNNEVIYPGNEEEVYKLLDMPYIIPELREDKGEIEAAIEDRLPDPVKLADIKGDLHVHSNWSDGINSIEEIAIRAREMGYEYVAITDHSKSLKVARGLDEERLMRQIELIKKLNEEITGIRILTGIEVDILTNELLDFDDEILKELDVVIASVHSGFKQDREKITRRIVAAMENPFVNIIAHPTGRILGKRDSYDVDIDVILKTAAETNTILEINSTPDRLDLNDHLAMKAKEMGVKMVINTDTHELEGLKDIRYGIWVARRGWLEKGDVINTLPLSQLLEVLDKK
ncbi:DNA polymerase/3'-5' exonuclease PolX [Thermosediminibacter oceani]|uniref:DNA polymerase beta n=1 Tax=Thermosediminibacter oceani (strain ATCC BAA-1034 / DSM 16646 / JW/IW-1228P) TaxID=555079 RepID=D9RXS5_THEOJ|nr:DNA polymerase/3'-5' exonuclease PolX [Thermosediminibacter oceani]ADL08149.1 PHP domain protein [Thermosediminibacter oceani DSM 16646]